MHTLPGGQSEERSCSFVRAAGRAIARVVFVGRGRPGRPGASEISATAVRRFRRAPQFHQRGAVARSPA